MEFKFKKCWNGMVLYKKYRVPTDSPGIFKTKWKKANEHEADLFYESLIENQIYRDMIKKAKNSHPEVFI